MTTTKDFIISVPLPEHTKFSKEIESLLKQAATEKSRGLEFDES